MSRPRIVIAGTGAFARVHAETLGRQQRLTLAGFFGTGPDAADAIAATFGASAYASMEAALADDTVDAIIVATPHATHLPIGLAALAAGKAVLIEKPLANSVAECDALIAAAGAGGRAMVGHLMRWSPAHKQARALITGGALGAVVSAESRRVIPWGATERRDWQKSAAAGGGMWLIQGVHVIDQLSFLLGRRAEAGIGLSRTAFHPGQSADDFGLALLRFGGVAATVTLAGTPARTAQVYSELCGTLGSLRVSHRGELLVDSGKGWQDRLVPVANHWTATLDAEMAAFADMLDGATPEPDFAYGRYVVSVVEAVRRSQQSGHWEELE